MIKRNLNPTIYTDGDTTAEVVWCTIHPNPATSVLCGVVYRPERGGEPNLIKICDSINKINRDNVVIMGDFNFRDINWDTNMATSPLSKKFVSSLEGNMLF